MIRLPWLPANRPLIEPANENARGGYAELHCRSYFSFLDGASSPEDLVDRARALGYSALAITDVDGVYGLPRAHAHARRMGFRILIGAEMTIEEDGRIVLLAMDAVGYARLCALVTRARLRCEKGRARATWEDVLESTAGLIALTGGAQGPIDRALAVGDATRAGRAAARLAEAYGDRAYVELTHHLRPGDDDRVATLARLARAAGLSPVVTQDARHAHAGDRMTHDVLTCIREKTTLAAAGKLLEANGERHLHEVAELRRRFAAVPDAVDRTAHVAARLCYSLEALRYRFPSYDIPDGHTAHTYLRHLVKIGAQERYGEDARAKKQLEHELGIIGRLDMAGYFLIVWDIVNFCRKQGILCQGRGSAANSAVCYALGITAVDPVGMELLFERFLSEERAETPDIDLDIAHQRREEVIQYVYRKYGRERTAMANEVITYRARSAVRDVGKTFGLSPAQIDRAAKALDSYISDGRVGVQPSQDVRAAFAVVGIDPDDPTVRHVMRISRAMASFPRHLGIHSGGMVITAGPIAEVVPVENATMKDRTVVQWDKDDLSQLGIIKIDLLGLGMLTVLDGALRLLREHQGIAVDLARLTPDDPEVYEMVSRADTVGVFQIESRAQMSFLPRHQPRNFYDLIVEVAIIRPGPIQGDMIHPYLRRRLGQEPVTYPHPSLEPVLRRTLGVPLFQEQGMKLAIVAAGFTPGEADELRRAMGHKRSHERMAAIQERLLRGMERNGIPREAAEKIFKQLSAFADYGFPESHAASFALLVYASAWIKRHHPAAFCAALLNAQPMGFYAPQTLVNDARRHGVPILPVCAVKSGWDAVLEWDDVDEAWGVRLGASLLRGVGEHYKDAFERARPFSSILDFARRSGFPREALLHLAAAGGFGAFGVSRREALWQLTALPHLAHHIPLLGNAPEEAERVALPAMDAREELAGEFLALGLSVDKHPAAMARRRLDRRGVLRAGDLASKAGNGRRVGVAGMVITRQRPPTAKGMVFITLEDETGICNLVLTPPVFERLRPLARDEVLVIAWGKVEREGLVINIRVEDMEPLRHEAADTAPTFKPRSFH